MKTIKRLLVVLFLLVVTIISVGCTDDTSDLVNGSTEGLVFEQIDYTREYAVTGYEGTNEKIVIASTYQGWPVTEITSDAFKGKEITSISLPDSITMVEAGAFAGFDLKEFVVPAGLYYFAQAFGANRTGIDFKLADNHPTLKEVTIDGNNIIVNQSETELIFAETVTKNHQTLVIPDTYTDIAPYAFSYTTYESVTVSASVTAIHEYTFYEAACLEIVLPDTITQIGEKAFMNTPDVSINIPSGIVTIEEFAFANSGLSGELILPEGLYEVESGAFNANALTAISIPSTCRYLAAYLFSNDGATIHSNQVTKVYFNTSYVHATGYNGIRFSSDYFIYFIYYNYMNQGYGTYDGEKTVITFVMPDDFDLASSIVNDIYDAWSKNGKPEYSNNEYGDFFLGFAEEWLVIEYTDGIH